MERPYFLRTSYVEKLNHDVGLDALVTPAQVLNCEDDLSIRLMKLYICICSC